MTALLTSLRGAADVEAPHTKPNCTTNGLSQINKPPNRVSAYLSSYIFLKQNLWKQLQNRFKEKGEKRVCSM